MRFLPRLRDEARGVLGRLTQQADSPVTDDAPWFIFGEQTQRAASASACPVPSQTAMAGLVLDLRNIYEPAEMRRHGFTYVSIGRST